MAPYLKGPIQKTWGRARGRLEWDAPLPVGVERGPAR